MGRRTFGRRVGDQTWRYRCTPWAQHWRLPSGFNTNVPERECFRTPRTSSPRAQAKQFHLRRRVTCLVIPTMSWCPAVRAGCNSGLISVSSSIQSQKRPHCSRASAAWKSGATLCGRQTLLTKVSLKRIFDARMPDSVRGYEKPSIVARKCAPRQ